MFLKIVIQIKVKIGIIIHKLTEVDLSIQCLNIAINQIINIIVIKNTANVKKEIDKNIHKNIVVFTVLIAADAANHTHTITKAKILINWLKLLFSIKLLVHFFSIKFEIYSKNIFNKKNHIIQNQTKAKGNKYSTKFQSHGINKAQIIKSTFIVIAKVKGIAKNVGSFFIILASLYSFVFL